MIASILVMAVLYKLSGEAEVKGTLNIIIVIIIILGLLASAENLVHYLLKV